MTDHPTPLGGTCSARFDSLRELFAAKLESGEDLGASLAVNVNGEMVVNLWGGWADEARTVPWTENTITCVFSTTKTMTSLAALVLVDRGELDLDACVRDRQPIELMGAAAATSRPDDLAYYSRSPDPITCNSTRHLCITSGKHQHAQAHTLDGRRHHGPGWSARWRRSIHRAHRILAGRIRLTATSPLLGTEAQTGL
jgi:hypothetical protein